MNTRTSIQGDVGVVTLSGALSFELHQTLKQATHPMLENPAIKVICVELAEVSAMDSSSLGMLLLLREKALAQGKSVELRKPSPIVLRILEVVQFGRLFDIT
ncbi:MAG: STAS domain-containing protein [Acidobacteria bacterium]|nr:STAS domain-containing protein [Acidobacteriota bacterium]